MGIVARGCKFQILAGDGSAFRKVNSSENCGSAEHFLVKNRSHQGVFIVEVMKKRLCARIGTLLAIYRGVDSRTGPGDCRWASRKTPAANLH
jgi:hypothetical protein